MSCTARYTPITNDFDFPQTISINKRSCLKWIVNDDELVAGRHGSGGQAFGKERPIEDVPLLQLPVSSHELYIEERQDEDAGNEGNTEDRANKRRGSQVVEFEGCSAFPNDKRVWDPGGESVEHGHREHAGSSTSSRHTWCRGKEWRRNQQRYRE
jgi:hypothetical protein